MIYTVSNEGVGPVGPKGDPPAPATVKGTPGSQTMTDASYYVVATTTDAATAVVDTGIAPANGHGMKIDGSYSVTDRTAHTVSTKNVAVALRQYGATVSVAGTPIVSGTVGDAALSTGTVTFSIIAGTLNVTFHPPAAYVGTLDWLLSIGTLEN